MPNTLLQDFLLLSCLNILYRMNSTNRWLCCSYATAIRRWWHCRMACPGSLLIVQTFLAGDGCSRGSREGSRQPSKQSAPCDRSRRCRTLSAEGSSCRRCPGSGRRRTLKSAAGAAAGNGCRPAANVGDRRSRHFDLLKLDAPKQYPFHWQGRLTPPFLFF